MRKFSFLIVLIFLAVGGILAWFVHSIAAVDPSNKTTKMFVIKQGEGVREIASHLKEDGLIREPVAFFLLVKQQGLDGKIQAGEFYLSPSMNMSGVLTALQTGTFDARLTIPEGKRAEEIADLLEEKLPNSYQPSWRQRLITNEGYLFPDTYSFAKDATIDTIITDMRGNFDKKYASIPHTNKSNLSQSELVTIASLVEREALYPEDRPLVASVIFNRLGIDMGLQLDATVQYALGYQPSEKSWWKKHLSLDDLKLDSPYNTYQTTGLPPTPISNPGIEALTAVLEAPDTDYLYYVSDSSGHNHYAKTLAQHNANIEKYGVH